MSTKTFQITTILIAFAFIIFFSLSVIPALVQDFDLISAFAAGFVNPYSSGYSADVIACWLILTVWVIYEKNSLNVRYGWVCIVLGVVPGVAVGLGAYLILRQKQSDPSATSNRP